MSRVGRVQDVYYDDQLKASTGASYHLQVLLDQLLDALAERWGSYKLVLRNIEHLSDADAVSFISKQLLADEAGAHWIHFQSDNTRSSIAEILDTSTAILKHFNNPSTCKVRKSKVSSDFSCEMGRLDFPVLPPNFFLCRALKQNVYVELDIISYAIWFGLRQGVDRIRSSNDIKADGLKTQINPSTFDAILQGCQVPLMLFGQPGIGRSALVRQLTHIFEQDSDLMENQYPDIQAYYRRYASLIRKQRGLRLGLIHDIAHGSLISAESKIDLLEDLLATEYFLDVSKRLDHPRIFASVFGIDEHALSAFKWLVRRSREPFTLDRYRESNDIAYLGSFLKARIVSCEEDGFTSRVGEEHLRLLQNVNPRIAALESH